MWLLRPRIELWVKLCCGKPRMVRNLYDLDKISVWREPTESKAMRRERLSIRIIEFIAMTVALVNFSVLIDGVG